MIVREIDLPGIGRKFEIEIGGGDKIVVIVHDDGRRELYHFCNGEDDSVSVISLEDTEARLLASIIGGMAYSPKSMDNVEVVIGGLVIEWYKVEEGSACIGKTIEEMNIRQATGVTILAVVEKNREKNINPRPDYQFKPNSTLIVTGERKNLNTFKNYIRDGR